MSRIKKIFKRKKTFPIGDPLKDAEAKLGPKTRLVPPVPGAGEETWSSFEHYYTTGKFSRTGKGYVQHCAPTAITNILCALDERYHYPKVHDSSPEEIFQRVAAIGSKRLLYINKKILRFWGGSNVFFISLYLRACLRAFDIRDRKVRLVVLGTSGMAARALEKGKLLLLQVYFHRTYGTHSVAAFGLANVQGESGQVRTYLKLADGWSDRPRYLALKDTPVLGYVSIE